MKSCLWISLNETSKSHPYPPILILSSTTHFPFPPPPPPPLSLSRIGGSKQRSSDSKEQGRERCLGDEEGCRWWLRGGVGSGSVSSMRWSDSVSAPVLYTENLVCLQYHSLNRLMVCTWQSYISHS